MTDVDGNAELVQQRVLVVDDEASILSALRRLLRHHKMEVLTADSGQAGLAILEHETVDVVISDMRMPGMSGAEFLEEVFSRWPETKRILLTGYADVASTIAAINRGKIWRYIAKPWNDDELLLTVQQAVGHRSLMQENARLLKLTQDQNEQLKTLNASLEEKVRRTGRCAQVAGDCACAVAAKLSRLRSAVFGLGRTARRQTGGTFAPCRRRRAAPVGTDGLVGGRPAGCFSRCPAP